MALSGKQQAFIEHYLVCWNATEAAKRAGYSEKTAYSIGSENLKKPEIDAAIKVRIGELKASADEVLLGLTDYSRGSMEDFTSVGENGEPWIDFSAAKRKNKLHLVKRFRVKKKSGDNWTETEVEVELYDAQRAKEMLGKAHGLFPSKIDVNWQDEFRRHGIDPDKALDKITDDLEEHLSGGTAEAAANGAGAGAGAD